MDSPIKTAYLPNRFSLAEVQVRLPVPVWYRWRDRISRWVYTPLGKKGISEAYPHLPHYELVAWPLYIVAFQISESESKTQKLYLSIDAWAQTASKFERVNDIQSEPIHSFSLIIKPQVKCEEIEQLAKLWFTQQILRQRKMLYPSVQTDTQILYLLYTPVWACYFARTYSALDVRLMDGYSGEKLGPQFRSAFLNALVQQKKQ